MANSFFGLGLQKFAAAGVSFTADTIKAGLWSTTYTPNLTTDEFFGISVPGGAVIAAGVALSSKTNALGVMSAANTTFTAVSGSAASYIGIYKDTGVANTSPLLILIDVATGLPVTPNGGDIAIAWSSGQVATLMQMQELEKERGYIRQIRDWMRDILSIPAELGPGGLWIPKPRLIFSPGL